MMQTSGGTGGWDHPPHHIITSHHIIYMAGRLSCKGVGQVRPHVLYQPCVVIIVYGGAVRGCGGFACAVQLHREVRPESGLVGIVEHIQVNER